MFQSWNLNIIQCGKKNLEAVPREIPMDSTTVFLDGNNLSKLGPETFLGRSKVTSLYLNSSKINGLNSQTFVGLSGLKELHLEHNELVSLDGGEFGGLSELEVLLLDNNNLEFISLDSLMSLCWR